MPTTVKYWVLRCDASVTQFRDVKMQMVTGNGYIAAYDVRYM